MMLNIIIPTSIIGLYLLALVTVLRYNGAFHEKCAGFLVCTLMLATTILRVRLYEMQIKRQSFEQEEISLTQQNST